MRIRLHLNGLRKTGSLRAAFALLILMLWTTAGLCDPIDSTTARRVAENMLRRHVDLYGDWNGSRAPVIADLQAVRCQGITVAYNFAVAPSGHVLVAVDDVFSPVPLYSTTSAFDPGRIEQAGTLESVMVPALRQDVMALTAAQRMRGAAAAAGDDRARERIRDAWSVLGSAAALTARAAAASGNTADDPQRREEDAGVTVGPLLTTAWNQGDADGPMFTYNLNTPAVDGGCSHALTGCVATAWAQVLRYWAWPIQGEGSHSYPWSGRTLSADFSTGYDWAHMPDVLSGTSSVAEKEAVSLLMYHLGVAADMAYGCVSSGSDAWADDILPRYFRYSPDARLCFRASQNETGIPYTSAEWFGLLSHELDADPPRPVIFSVYTDQGGGHEVVVDGYQSENVDRVHINFGWSGYYDGFINITSDFQAGQYLWTADDQCAVIGIEPYNNTPPIVSAGDDQTVDAASQVRLSGSAADSEGAGIRSYDWLQISGPAVALSDAALPNPTFTAPSADAQSDLVFQLRATDANRAFATDTCTVVVAGGQASIAETPPASGDGGCFIALLRGARPWSQPKPTP